MDGSTVDQQQQPDQAASTDTTADKTSDQQTTTDSAPATQGETDQSHEQSPVHYPADSPPAVAPATTVTGDVYSSYQLVQLPTMNLTVEYKITAGDILVSTLLAFIIIMAAIHFFHRLVFPKGGA